MTVSVITGLCIQAVAVWLVHVAIKGEWVRRPAALTLLIAVLGHGITELMQWFWPGRNHFRRFVDQSMIDDWVLLVSVAVLLYAISYVWVVRGVHGGRHAVLRAPTFRCFRAAWSLS